MPVMIKTILYEGAVVPQTMHCVKGDRHTGERRGRGYGCTVLRAYASLNLLLVAFIGSFFPQDADRICCDQRYFLAIFSVVIPRRT